VLAPKSCTQFDRSAADILSDKITILKGLVGGMIRAVADSGRRRELSQRLLEFQQYDHLLNALAKPLPRRVESAADLIPFPLLVTTNRGLYVLDQGAWRCLLPIVCFGIARHEGTLFIGASAGIHSFILSAKIVGDDRIDGLRDVRVLWQYETRYHNERVHQIAFDPGANVVHCANCRRNSLLAVDCGGRGIVDEKHLFLDGTGFPVTADQNHINSVTMNADVLLFAAHTAGNGAALGYVAGDVVRAHQYSARGIHDIVIHDDGIMFTDSFRDGEAAQRPQASGAIRYRGEEYLSQAIGDQPQKFVLRGLSIKGDFVGVGVSAHARREDRLTEAGGGVIVFRGEKMLGYAEGPFSQTYDILPADGHRTDAAGPARSVTELDIMFRRDVGPLLYEGKVLRTKSAKGPHP
jgi:hypothetical protein